jgi:hypothetical protein
MFLKSKVAVLEFDGDTIRLAVVQAGGRLPSLLEAHSATAEYEEPEERLEALTATLDGLMDEVSTRPAATVLCVSGTYSVVRTLSIPFRGKRRVSAAVPFEIEPFLAFPLEELLLDFNVVGEFDGETEVLAMGLRREQVEEIQAVLEAAEVEAEAVCLDVPALTGLWKSAGLSAAKGLSAVLHMGECESSLAILHNGTLAFYRPLNCSVETLAERPEGVAREANNTLRSFLANWRGGGELETLHVTGVELDAGAHQCLSEALSMEIESAVLLERISGQDRIEEVYAANRWENLIAVGHGAAGGGGLVDLQRSEQGWSGAGRALAGHLMFSACLALLVLMGWAFHYHQGSLQNAGAAQVLEQAVEDVNKEVNALEKKGIPGDTSVFQSPTVLALLEEIVEKMPSEKVSITSVIIAPPESKGAWLKIKGTAKDASVFNVTYEQLKTSHLFAVEESPKLSLHEGMTQFEIKAFQRDEGEENVDNES